LAVVTTGLAAAALLSGPAATWALDATGVTGSTGTTTSQVTNTTQPVVSSTQQTAATTVTTVENAAQTTVQTTQQAAAPVVDQVQSSAPAVTSAPAQPSAPAARPVVRKNTSVATSAPAQHASPVTAGGGRSQQTTAVTRSVASAGSVARTSRQRLTTTVAAATHTKRSTRSSDATAQSVTPRADKCSTGVLQILSPLLSVAPTLGTLVTTVCDAGSLLSPPAEPGGGRESLGLPLDAIEVLGAFASGGDPLHARASATGIGTHRLARVPLMRDGRGGGLGGASGDGANAPADGARGGYATNSSLRGAGWAQPGTTAGSAPNAGASAGHGHHGLFGTSITGTEIVFALLVLDWALLVAAFMWRVARRRPLQSLTFAMRARRSGAVRGERGRLTAALFAVIR
jgi:hypothetical protein